jgi:hypothetical protein
LLPGFHRRAQPLHRCVVDGGPRQRLGATSRSGEQRGGIVAELQKFASVKGLKAGELLIGYGYDENLMPGGKLLTRDVLTRLSRATRSSSSTCRCTAPC